MAHAEEIDAHVRKAMFVFGALMVLTIVTVAVAYLHLPIVAAVAVALVIATTKGSLVALYFMHLISERGLIYLVLAFTVAFFFVLLFLPVLSSMDPIQV